MTGYIWDSGRCSPTVLDIQNSGLRLAHTATTGRGACAADPVITSGKWYWEVPLTYFAFSDYVGLVDADWTPSAYVLGYDTHSWGMVLRYGRVIYNNAVLTYDGPEFINDGDIMCWAVDMDNGYAWIGQNGTWSTGDPATGTSPLFTGVTGDISPAASLLATSSYLDSGFTAAGLTYTPPTGFLPLDNAIDDDEHGGSAGIVVGGSGGRGITVSRGGSAGIVIGAVGGYEGQIREAGGSAGVGIGADGGRGSASGDRGQSAGIGVGATGGVEIERYVVHPTSKAFSMQRQAVRTNQINARYTRIKEIPVEQILEPHWLYGCGLNDKGQVGDYGSTDRLRPTQLYVYDNYTKISSGHYHAVGLRDDGTLWGWGSNNHGQLNTAPNNPQRIPVQISGEKFRDVRCFANTTIAIKRNYELWMCGEAGSIVPRGRWGAVDGGSYYYASERKHFFIGLKRNMFCYGWGDNDFGQLGRSPSGFPYIPPGLETLITPNARLIGCGNEFAMYYNSTGLYSAGRGDGGYLGYPLPSESLYNAKFSRVGLFGLVYLLKELSVGSYHTVALDIFGGLWIWGSNWYGQLGIGVDSLGGTGDGWFRAAPIRITGYGEKYTAIAASSYLSRNNPGHTLVRRDDGVLLATGANTHGQCGLNSPITNVNTLTEVDYGSTGWGNVISCGEAFSHMGKVQPE